MKYIIINERTNESLSLIKFAEWAKSSLSQQSFAT